MPALRLHLHRRGVAKRLPELSVPPQVPDAAVPELRVRNTRKAMKTFLVHGFWFKAKADRQFESTGRVPLLTTKN